MKKKLEEKILEEIRNKVIENDLNRKNDQEIKAMREANIEALTELTSLSRKEVEKIAEDVKKGYLIEQQRKQKRIILFVLFIVVFGGILFFVLKPKPALQIRMVEDDFSENKFEWALINSFNYKRYFENDQYIIETSKKDWCYWDNVAIDFPKNYDIEVSSIWLNGKFDSYGIALLKSNTDYYAFTIRADGAATFGKVVEKNWEINDTWKDKIAKTGKKQSNIQRVEVRNGAFSYFVNNNLVRTGTVDMPFGFLALRCCGEQQVGYEYVKITNQDTKKVIFEDDFKVNSGKWSAEKDFLFESKFETGRLAISSNYGSECNWCTSATHQITDNCEIELSSVWLSGELADYGLMILSDDENYYSLELQNNGNARFVERNNAVYSYVQNYIKTPYESDGLKTIIQKIEIKDNEIRYSVNNQLIKKQATNLLFPCKIALRVCGKQSVAFDKLSIKYYESE